MYTDSCFYFQTKPTSQTSFIYDPNCIPKHVRAQYHNTIADQNSSADVKMQ